ncbi:MAG: alanine--tRNA ligase [Alphaproteobacteria bacterium]|nr:alanine--tRNA ligase [Alphaproteobacteria bacterium]
MTVTVNQIRSTFLNYFGKNGHKIIQSSPLVPDNDPTLMFTNSGMVQFKNILAGNETRDYVRAATAQKSVRAGGKHNDLDSVGYDVRHHTFFEMLGNFSFGDYFKEGAILYAWELLTKEFDIPKEKLAVTIYHNDDEAHDLWKKIAGLPEDRIIRIATKDNFWQMGDTGPCGPCSEIFYDHGPEVWGGLPGTPEEDGDRFIEIWNLVFDQFEDLPDGSRVNIKKPSIDTGMGLERIAAILQGVHSNFDIDLFQNLIGSIADLANSDPKGKLQASHNVIADHMRSAAFLIADGVLPSNEGRGYVLRRIMRRAMRHVHMLGVKEPMMYKLLPTLQKEMGEAYPELYRAEALIRETLKTEESKFIKTLEKGLKLLDEETADMSAGDTLNGETAFKLYDTYGFPLDLTQDALKNKDINVDVDGFNTAMERQRAEARKNWAGSGDEGVEKIWFEVFDKLGKSEFLGYSSTKADGEIKALVQNSQLVDSVKEGNFYLVANQTPFYGESGGQVGDTGFIKNKDFVAEVVDTKKKIDGMIVHICKLVSGEAKVGEFASFEINEENRNKIRANHSVTHLLHRALRDILGEHVTQKGSMVAPDRARFDISHHKQVTAEELRHAENIVNEAVRKNYNCVTRIMTPEEAVAAGAMALFGEKYGETVRVVSMENEGEVFSRELCGGTHVNTTGDIGYFNIVSESAVAAGVRRIEFMTGYAAEKYTQDMEDKLHQISQMLRTSPNDIEARIRLLMEEKKKLEAEILRVRKNFASNKAADNKEKFEEINGVKFAAKVLNNISAKELKGFIDEVKQQIESGIIVLFSCTDNKVSAVIGVTEDLTSKYSANDLIKVIAPYIGAKGGGGRPDMAQTGGSDLSQLNEAVDALRKAL